jgi:hypothetical protein
VLSAVVRRATRDVDGNRKSANQGWPRAAAARFGLRAGARRAGEGHVHGLRSTGLAVQVPEGIRKQLIGFPAMSWVMCPRCLLRP